MNEKIKKTDFTIVSEPVYVSATCPYCELEFDVDYKDMAMISDYPGEWEGETIECPDCDGEIIIDSVGWD